MTKLDPIATFMGEITDDERQERDRIAGNRDVATTRLGMMTDPTARQLCIMAANLATLNLYTPGDMETLAEFNKLLRRLLICADMAEAIFGGDDDGRQ